VTTTIEMSHTTEAMDVSTVTHLADLRQYNSSKSNNKTLLFQYYYN